MKLGTARITLTDGWHVVDYCNIGSCLRCTPQWFQTEAEAREFCRSRLLTII